MPAKSQLDFISMALDPDLLAAPFKIQTNWHVITGAACSGKSTLIDQLAGEGFQTAPESARQYSERELAKGRTIEEIRADRTAFMLKVYAMMVEREQGLGAGEIRYLDRGIPDGLAYYRFSGLNPNEILPDCFQHRYASVFMLDRLPYRKDGVRVSNDATAAYFDRWLVRDYLALGYEVIRVPVLPPEDRLAFVLERL